MRDGVIVRESFLERPNVCVGENVLYGFFMKRVTGMLIVVIFIGLYS